MLRRFASCFADASPVIADTGAESSRSFSQKVFKALRIQDDELADLLVEPSHSKGFVVSPWREGEYSRNSILFPNDLIESHRGIGVPPKNVDRLAYLWSISSSHGVSWDELDDAFLSFHRDYLKAETEWGKSYEDRFQAEYKNSMDLLRNTMPGEEAQITLALNRRRGKIRRMTYKRLSRMRLKEVIRPFQLSSFKQYMRDFVSVRVVKREQSDRDL